MTACFKAKYHRKRCHTGSIQPRQPVQPPQATQAPQTEQPALQNIKDLKAASKFELCVNKAQEIKQNSRIYSETQSLLNECQTVKNAQILAEVERLTNDGKCEEASAKAATIPKNTPTANDEAKTLVDQCWQKVLSSVDPVDPSASSTDVKTAPKLIDQRKNEQTDKDYLEVAEKNLKQRKWQAVIDIASKVMTTCLRVSVVHGFGGLLLIRTDRSAGMPLFV